MPHSIHRALAALLLIPMVATCGGGGEPSDPVAVAFLLAAPPVPGSGPWANIVHGQSYTITAIAVDAHGEPVAAPGIAVELGVTLGAAILTGVTTGVTGADGRVSLTDLVLTGPAAATELTLSSDSLPSVHSPTFILRPGAAASIVKVSGDSQTTIAGSPTPDPLVIEVRDGSANPVPGVLVQVGVAEGQGTIGGGATVTRATGLDGRLSVADWATAPLLGPNGLALSIPSRPEVPGVLFSARTRAGEPHHFTQVSDWPSAVPVDTALTTPVVVTLRDSRGNPIPGARLRWHVYGDPLPGDTITDSLGEARLAGWHTPTEAGVYPIIANVGGGPPYAQRFVSVTPGPVVRIDFASDSAMVAPDGAELELLVRLFDRFGNPAVGRQVGWQVVSGPGQLGPHMPPTIATNSEGTAFAEVVLPPGTTGRTVFRATPVTLSDSVRDFVVDGVHPVALVRVAGDSQAVTAGATLPLPLRVRAVDSAGVGVRGIPVHFDDTPPGMLVLTDSAGLVDAPAITARVTLVKYQLQARSPWMVSAVATWTVVPHAGPPAKVVQHTTPGGRVGEALAATLAVRVTDANKLSAEGVYVHFSTSQGQLLGDSSLTNAIGVATVPGWILDTVAGTQHLSAAAGAAPPADITVTALPGPTHKLTIVSTGALQGFAGEQIGHGMTVEGRDRYGNLAAGRNVVTAIASGPGSPLVLPATLSPEGRAYLDGWLLGAPGTTSVLRAISDSASVEATATSLVPSPFRIILRGVPSAYAGIFNRAAFDWRRRITADIPDIFVSIPAGVCAGFQESITGTVDDLVIDVSIGGIDGPGGILGGATPCFIRTAGNLPLLGMMLFDAADAAELVAEGTFGDVVLHEMGHVLGVGSLWSMDTLITGRETVNPQYIGAGGKLGWAEIGGVPLGTVNVPVENTGGPGTRDVHWREAVMPSELMTGYLSAAVNPMSAVTVRSLTDLGYTVDASTADPYTVMTAPMPAPGRAPRRIQDQVGAPRFTVDENGKVTPIR